jgi:MFS family permease
VCGLLATFTAIYLPTSMPILYLCLFGLGVAGSAQSLAFCVVRDISHPRHLGTAMGFNNMATIAGAAILQPVIGYLLHKNWQGVTLNHVPFYSAHNYRLALVMIPLCYLLALLISTRCIPETHCRQQW